MTSMASQKSGRFTIWFNQAKYDLEAAKKSFDDRNYEWSCYQSVQAVEKALKAVIVQAGWKPPMTHKLGILMSICNKANNYFSGVKLRYRVLESYTFVSRYPFIYPDSQKKTPHDLILVSDAQACVAIATDLLDKVDSFLNTGTSYEGVAPEVETYYYTNKEVEDRIREVIEKLKTSDQIKIQKVILFGSFSRENEKPRTSTMDILIIGFTTLPFIERLTYVRELTKGGEPIIEPLVYTPDEFKYMVEEEGEGFLESAIAEGRVIFQQ
ncbi:MAG: HEPN domain-containing protein [Candidatus Dojkabacteria bacterium]